MGGKGKGTGSEIEDRHHMIRQRVCHTSILVAKMSELFYACKSGDFAGLRRLISNELDPRKDILDLDYVLPGGVRTTPLHVASR